MTIFPRKVYWWVGGGGEWQTKFNVSPGPGLWSLVLGPFGPDLGPDLDLTWDLDLDLSLTTVTIVGIITLLLGERKRGFRRIQYTWILMKNSC